MRDTVNNMLLSAAAGTHTQGPSAAVGSPIRSQYGVVAASSSNGDSLVNGTGKVSSSFQKVSPSSCLRAPANSESRASCCAMHWATSTIGAQISYPTMS